jgi:ribose transport system substrate-binding protein
VAAAAAAALVASACSTSGAQSNGSSSSGGTQGPWTIGLSNGYYGNGARIQIEAEAKAYAALPNVKPKIKNFIINNAGTSVPAQIQAVDNMIAEHVDAILLDSNSLDGLNTAIKQAQQAGIIVVAYNDKVSSPLAYQVGTVGEEYGAAGMQALVKSLNGKGSIVILRGLAGNAVDAAEAQGFNGVLAHNPGIHVLNTSYGGWDEATAQNTTADLLSRYSNIDGVYTEGGMAQGVVRAYLAAHRKFVPVIGTDTNGFAGMLKQYQSQGLTGYQVSSHVWEGALAVKAALELLSGKKMPHQIPIQQDSWSSSEAVQRYIPGQPPSLFLEFQDPGQGITLTSQQVLAKMS